MAAADRLVSDPRYQATNESDGGVNVALEDRLLILALVLVGAWVVLLATVL